MNANANWKDQKKKKTNQPTTDDSDVEKEEEEEKNDKGKERAMPQYAFIPIFLAGLLGLNDVAQVNRWDQMKNNMILLNVGWSAPTPMGYAEQKWTDKQTKAT